MHARMAAAACLQCTASVLCQNCKVFCVVASSSYVNGYDLCGPTPSYPRPVVLIRALPADGTAERQVFLPPLCLRLLFHCRRRMNRFPFELSLLAGAAVNGLHRAGPRCYVVDALLACSRCSSSS
jgi:hypothetical protein